MSYPNGGTVHGAMDQALQRRVPGKHLVFTTTTGVNIARESLCDLCAIVRGVTGRFASHGRFNYFLRFAVDAAGRLTVNFGITAPGASKICRPD